MRKSHTTLLGIGLDFTDMNSGLSMDFINDPNVAAYFSQRNAKVYAALWVIFYMRN